MHPRSLLLPVLLLVVSSLQAGPATTANTLNFRDVDIREVTQAISEITGRNFILDPRVKGKVTVISSRPISADAVYATYLSMLQVQGFTTVPAGAMIKIVPNIEARQMGGPLAGADGLAPDDVVTTVLELENVSAGPVLQAVRNLIATYGYVQHIPGTNLIVVSDHAGNVARLERILARIDKAVDGEVEVITLQNATAGEVVRVVGALNAGVPKDAGSPGPTIVADERTNSVLIGGGKGDRLRIRTLVTYLDTPLKQDGNTQVLYLRYAEAENLAKILTGYVQAESARPGGGAPAAGGTAGTIAGSAGGTVSILPEPDTNALVITAPPKEMRSIRSVIEKLDIRRAQVLVEAIIVEMSQEKAAELGVTWAIDATGTRGMGALTNFGNSGTGVAQIGAAASAGGAIPAAAIPDGLTFGVGKVNAGGVSFASILRALAGDATSNVLSTPSLLTMDNEEAEFKSGQEVPFLTGQYTGTGGTNTPTNPFQTIERKEVGVKLKIKPQINEGDAVFLEIEQEVSSLASTTVSTVDAVTNKRTISTRVIANDGEIIVLGGLIDDNLRESEQRVPYLGAIPVLGNLFRYRSSTKTKQNLMVFLRPTIINDGIEATYHTESKYNQMRDLQLSRNPKRVDLMPGSTRPVLPEFERPTPAPDAESEGADDTDAPPSRDDDDGDDGRP
jgi:general secretion pathway protein D